jgi:hypothetical protein
MRHPTYKHLEARLRIGPFSLGQWAQITTAAAAAAVFAGYVSPLGTQATIFVSIVAAGMPLALSYGAMGLEFSVLEFARAAWRYWRQPCRFIAGPGEPTVGYLVLADAQRPASTRASQARTSEGALLWDV